MSVGVYTGTQPPSASTGDSHGATPDAVAFLVGKFSGAVCGKDLKSSERARITADLKCRPRNGKT
ncbi:hypothetical protein A2U01_0062565 [Trifolium medium]|uniref:Uncharacterized protein n=1 Tax=Trifolium medium TaxID=97028 RepID=A0A392RYW9_9FABA|nr:hypothetical protein [Trifolium medium]